MTPGSWIYPRPWFLYILSHWIYTQPTPELISGSEANMSIYIHALVCLCWLNTNYCRAFFSQLCLYSQTMANQSEHIMLEFELKSRGGKFSCIKLPMLHSSDIHRHFERRGKRKEKQVQILFWLPEGVHLSTYFGSWDESLSRFEQPKGQISLVC